MRISLSQHTLDVNLRKFSVDAFDFSEVEEYVLTLAAGRDYQFDALKRILIYLWGGSYENLAELARENYRRKPAIQQRFNNNEAHFMRMLPLPDRLSGVCHMATGAGKSYVMFGIAHLALALGKVQRVLILGPSSTVIESGLREKFKEYLYGERGALLRAKLPERFRHKVIRLLNCNDTIEDSSIVIENINAIYNRETNALGDTLFNHGGEVLVLSDEVHHAYAHLDFHGEAVAYDYEEGAEGRGDDRDERLWMKFLRESKAIKRHIGFTGTPYSGDDYFPDVIYNYSIKDAMEEKIIKRIRPIIKTETDEGDNELTPRQKYEQVLTTHQGNKIKYAYTGRDGRPLVKPITIFINATQSAAERNHDAFALALADAIREEKPAHKALARATLEQMARDRMILVIAKMNRSEYQQKLDQIEETDPGKVGGKVEFIFAVNKLSEGWDVDNVFQIVPAEERVFNSKLLISQVLGRGLRLPRQVRVQDIQGNYPVVTITNHDKFAAHIRELLDEVTDCELRLTSGVLTDPKDKRHAHNFNLFNLQYAPATRLEDRTPEELQPESGRRELILTPSAEKLGVRVTYLDMVKRFEFTKDYCTVDQMVLDVERRFKSNQFESRHFDFGDGILLDEIPGEDEINRIIRRAMARAGITGDRLSMENRQQIEIYFNQFLPKGTKRVIHENKEGGLTGIATAKMDKSSARAGGLDNETAVFVSEDYETELDEANRFVIKQIVGGEQDLFDLQGTDFNREYIRQMVGLKHLYAVNTSLFRTPQSLVIVSHAPERQFLFRLIEEYKVLTAWIKAPDRAFYSLDYEYWKGGKDRVRRSFNPDFFIRLNLADYLTHLPPDPASPTIVRLREIQDRGVEDLILVVEIKDDDDDSEETKGKSAAAPEHFRSLNARIRQTNPLDLPEEFRTSTNQLYAFWVLHPAEYTAWFSRLRTGLIVFNFEVLDSESSFESGIQ